MLRCFVATAVGHEDVDRIYDRCIVPVLRKLSVTPLRVDRVEHNEDIDTKIFELLDSADFVIADLTYARPSAYYEAGYAAGKSKPVVYIARRDHLRARDNDPHGNYRVHFDLQMRNVIPWTTPDLDFSNRLLARLRLVARPLLRDSTRNTQLLAERLAFSRRPIAARLRAIRDIAIRLLRQRSFGAVEATSEAPTGNSAAYWSFLRRENRSLVQAVALLATTTATKQLYNYFSWHSMYIRPSDESKNAMREAHYVILCLNSVPQSRITEALPNFVPQSDATVLLDYGNPRIPEVVKTYVHTIDRIQSESEFTSAFRKLVENSSLRKGA